MKASEDWQLSASCFGGLVTREYALREFVTIYKVVHLGFFSLSCTSRESLLNKTSGCRTIRAKI